MHAVHAGYTVIARLKEGCAEVAQQLLVDFNADPERLPCAKMATTHFATGAVLPAQMYGDEELPATLMLATSFSGPSRAHEDDLVRIAGRGLRELFQHCEGFPEPCSDAQLARFLREHRQADTFYSGMQHLTREDVLRHDQVRTEIETFVDHEQETGGFTGLDAGGIRLAIQKFVANQPRLAWATSSWEPAAGSWLALHWRTLLVAAVVLPFLAALVIGSIALVFVPSEILGTVVASGWIALALPVLVLVILVLGVRDAELQQRYVAGRQADEHVRALSATQCHPVINEMLVFAPIKEGSTRPMFLRLALWIVARVAEGIPGLRSRRAGINIPTVATARWIAIDRGKRLVFISNFTNASEPYVRDFIDIRFGAMRINLTFGFGAGYPRTEWVINRGAVEDPNGFINVVNANQHRTPFWFCPYNNLSIDNIKLNRTIREGLFGTATEAQAKAWLQLL